MRQSKSLESLSYSIETRRGRLFFDTKKKGGSEFLKITQSKSAEGGIFLRNDIFIDRDELLLFRDAIEKALDFWNLNQSPITVTKPSNKKEEEIQFAYSYAKWDAESDELLGRLYDEGHTISQLSDMFERSKGAIRSRLKVIGKM